MRPWPVTIVAAQKGILRDLRAKLRSCENLSQFKSRIRYASIDVYEKELWP